MRAHIAKIADRALRNVTAKGSQGNEMDALEMDQYSELQEAANILREGVEDLDDLINHSIRQNAQVEALLKQQASVISFLGSSIQAARVVSVSRLMPGLRRIVRTVSSDLGKAVQFRVLNEVGSLDRDNHARCQVILEHMVRNALDHGIESPAERIAAGKPAAGRITIDVNKNGGDYIVELTDDGRGIDPDVMRETAFDKGLDVDVDALSDAEAQRLIFHKGFSTAEELSEISGKQASRPLRVYVGLRSRETVEARADLLVAQGGAVQGLLNALEGDPVALHGDHRQAGAAHGDGVADLDTLDYVGRLDHEPGEIAARLERRHPTRCLDDAGEHGNS